MQQRCVCVNVLLMKSWPLRFLLFVTIGCGATTDDAPAPNPIETPPSTPAPPTQAAPIGPDAAPIALDPPAVACAGGVEAVDLQIHACFHSSNGPFADVRSEGEVAAPSISKAHTAYRIALGGGEARWVSFTPKVGGLYALYTGPAARLAFRTAAGARVAVVCEGPTEPDACPALPFQVQARLDAGVAVRIAIFPGSGEPAVQLVIENVE